MINYNPMQSNMNCGNRMNYWHAEQQIMEGEKAYVDPGGGELPTIQSPYANPYQAMQGLTNNFFTNLFNNEYGNMFQNMMKPFMQFFGPMLSQMFGSQYGQGYSQIQGWQSGPRFAPQEPIAANEDANVWGDPHFTGADGQKFNFQGQAGKNYDLFSDSGVQLNGHFTQWGNTDKNVIDKTGLTINGLGGYSTVDFNKEGVAKINGMELKNGKEVRLADGGTAHLEGKTLTITTAEGYQIKETTNGQYMTVDVKSGPNGVAEDGHLPGGLMGQTFRPDWMAEGDTEKNPEKYASQFEVGNIEAPSYNPFVMEA